MRKADYRHLADIMRHAQAAGRGVTYSAEFKRGYLAALEAVARQFANRASVDPRAFLKACGIE